MKILIAATRELCYFSGSFFLNRMQESLEKMGAEVVRLDLAAEGADFSLLEKEIGRAYDAILDINSKLPYLVDEKGRRVLDRMEAPFFNYIIDHPLYHHPGLSFPLRDYHAIGIDAAHCEYMKRHYPGLQSVDFQPMGGSRALLDLPFADRRESLLFLGTYLKDAKLDAQILALRNQLNNPTYQLAMHLYEEWDDERETLEDCLYRLLLSYSEACTLDEVEEYISEVYELSGFSELLNHMFLVDQKRRNQNRLDILTAVAKAGGSLTVMGEGWEHTPLTDYGNVEIRPGVTMEQSIEQMARHRFLLDVNPAFSCGLHDRVASALANGCVTVSNMSRGFDADISHGKNILFYKKRSASEIPEMLRSITPDEAEEISRGARDIWRWKYSWECHTKRLVEIFQSAG